MDHLQKAKKEYKNLRKKQINDIFTKTNQIKLFFNMTWLIEIQGQAQHFKKASQN